MSGQPAAIEQHTPEPWDFKQLMLTDPKTPYHVYAISGGGWSGGRTLAETDDWLDRPDGNAEADARRIVACVNACAGLDTAKLEEGVGILAEFLPFYLPEPSAEAQP